MNSAVVMATDHGKAILLISGGIFREVKNRQYYVGQRLNWDEEKSLRSAHVLRRGLLIAACFVLLLTSSAYAVTKYVPLTMVSVALGETSIQYRLNALNEVLSAEADTEEGQAILETVSTEPYEPLQTAMERTLSAIQEETEADAPVLVEIAPRFGDGKQAEEAVEKAGEKTETQVRVEKAPWHEPGKPKDPPPREHGPADEPTEQNMHAPAVPEQTMNRPGMYVESAEQNMKTLVDSEPTQNEPNMDARIVPGNPEAVNQSPPASGMEPVQQEPKEEKEQFQQFNAGSNDHEGSEQQLLMPLNAGQDMNQGFPNSMTDQSVSPSVTEKKDDPSSGFHQGEQGQEKLPLFNAENIPYKEPGQQSLPPQAPIETTVQQAQNGTLHQSAPSSATGNPSKQKQEAVDPALLDETQFPVEKESLDAETHFWKQNADVDSQNDSHNPPASQGSDYPLSQQSFSSPPIGGGSINISGN